MQIENEESFKSLKTELIWEQQSYKSDRFVELENLVKDVLDRYQDSDKALTLITKGALSFWSSDIHYDFREWYVQLRFRIDWSLADVFTLSFAQYKLLLERLKYKSDLKLNISNIPQDGKYRIEDEEKKLDVRVSTLPVKLWENVVCRILDSSAKIPTVDDLWFVWASKRQIEKSVKRKNWMILVTWPTWSWKTTTLYSILNTLNTQDRKIITLEDPIEYELPWIVQSEVNEKNWYTFANWLKALMRQDPDVIMIWEIRDLETAQIAAQAALTWHLVLATLHTKSAAETIERLLNMWLPSYILSSAIDIIIAQRLVRKNCWNCMEKIDATSEQNEIIKWMMKDIWIEAVARAKTEWFKLYRWAWCTECWHSWYKWRLWVYEVMAFNDKIRTLIRDWESPEKILEEARKQDMMIMREDWVLKAMRWKTTLEELFRVID